MCLIIAFNMVIVEGVIQLGKKTLKYRAWYLIGFPLIRVVNGMMNNRIQTTVNSMTFIICAHSHISHFPIIHQKRIIKKRFSSICLEMVIIFIENQVSSLHEWYRIFHIYICNSLAEILICIVWLCIFWMEDEISLLISLRIDADIIDETRANLSYQIPFNIPNCTPSIMNSIDFSFSYLWFIFFSLVLIVNVALFHHFTFHWLHNTTMVFRTWNAINSMNVIRGFPHPA